ncbi:MAG TPA: hypothetical protein VF230_14000 [Acidimicrobiales bacterium]
MRHRLLVVAAAALVLAPVAGATAGPLPIPTPDPDVVPDVVQTAAGCDPLDPALCLLPFPNDFFTRPDATSATGRRVNLSPAAMPRNGTDVTTGEAGGEGKPVDPAEWNRNDGFSPGSPVVTYVPGIDLHRTWGTATLPHSTAGINEPGYFDHRDQITDVDLSLDPEAPIVIVNAATGERHPFWSELDVHPQTGDDRRALIIRPARNFDEGARYIVALRSLKDSAGRKLAPGAAFLAYRDGTAADARAAHMQSIFATLDEKADIGRHNLFLAWDFTVASEGNLADRALHIRDDAFGRLLGDADLADRHVAGSAPEFTVDGVENRTDTWRDSHGVQHSQALRRISGRVRVPNYLDRVQQTEAHVRPNELPYDPPAPGSRFLYLPGDDLPDQNPAEPFVDVPFVCDVPTDEGPTYGTLYGHGLLGMRDQIGDVKWPRRFGFNGCAADWWGMSSNDIPTVASIIADLSNFPSLADRAQQGFLNFMFLGRAMVHPSGFVSDPAFQNGGSPLLAVDHGEGTQLYYDGNSQGGIMGGALVALSPDITRGILGVTGMNYSTLLQRSVDWEDLYAIAFYATYQDPLEQQVSFALMQMLWDRGEANGYAAHMTTDPYRNTPPHDVMLQIAFADHQVSNHAAEVKARTVGAAVMQPGLPEGRHWERSPYFSPTDTYPHQGSALVYWDSGNAPSPNLNLPPNAGADPHGHPRNEPAAGWQEAHFLLTGWMVDVCAGGPYLTLRHPSNAGAPSCREPAYRPGSAGL